MAVERQDLHSIIAPWRAAGRQALISGTLGSFLSTAVLALFGKTYAGSAAAPTNATSHWLWGDRAYEADETSARHTGVGYVTHHASAVFWATLYEHWLNRRPHRSTSEIVAGAAVATAAAALIDYNLVPARLRPGFEKRLSPAATVATFIALGCGLALGAAANRRQERRIDRLMTLP